MGHPSRRYAWSKQYGFLTGTPLTKNRFEQIIRNIHYVDRGPGPYPRGHWWDKLAPILDHLRTKCQLY
jgi:hypothetical protein